jgi:hypothetical protein
MELVSPVGDRTGLTDGDDSMTGSSPLDIAGLIESIVGFSL